MTKGRIALAVLVAILVALVSGWLWGASGRHDMERALGDAELRLDLAEARGAALAARASLFTLNFGDASRELQNAKEAAERARKRMEEQGHREPMQHVSTAIARLDEAQRLAVKVDQSANKHAADAVKALEAARGGQ